MGREGWLGHKAGVRVHVRLSISFLLLFLGKYATKSLSEKQSVFLMPCQTLQGKHYRLNCLIPICIIQRSDNCKNRDAKGRLRATYARCQPFAVGKAKLRTSAGMSSPAGSPTPTSLLPPQEPFPPLRPPDTCTHRVFAALWWGFQPYFSTQEIFHPGTVWSRTFQRILVGRAVPQKMRQQTGMICCMPWAQRLALCLAWQPIEGRAQQNLSLDKPISPGSPILQTSPDILKI